MKGRTSPYDCCEPFVQIWLEFLFPTMHPTKAKKRTWILFALPFMAETLGFTQKVMPEFSRENLMAAETLYLLDVHMGMHRATYTIDSYSANPSWNN